MDHRMDDLRGWWDRTRRRRLKPGVRSVVERVRPAAVREGSGIGPAVIAAEPVVDVPPDAARAPDELGGSGQPWPSPAPAAVWDSTRAPGSWPEMDVAPDDQPDGPTEGDEPEPARETEREVPTGLAGDPGARIDLGEQVPDADGGPDPAPPAAEEDRPIEATSETSDAPEPARVEPSDVVEPPDVVDPGWAPPGSAPWETSVPASSAEAPEPTRPDETVQRPERGSVAEAGGQAPDEWAGIAWSAADQPAPWSAAPDVADEDPLGLDDDQRRWLDRDVKLVDGIGPGYGGQLEAVGIRTLRELLLRGATRRGRQEIGDATGVSGKLILRWVNNADLFRIRGVGTQYADLLEAAGVDTVVELALRRAGNLAARLATTNEIRSLVRQVPSEVQVADWVRQARELPRIVAY